LGRIIYQISQGRRARMKARRTTKARTDESAPYNEGAHG
jgi:hypothetical protein